MYINNGLVYLFAHLSNPSSVLMVRLTTIYIDQIVALNSGIIFSRNADFLHAFYYLLTPISSLVPFWDSHTKVSSYISLFYFYYIYV
jgi:hypothetical protein